MHDWGNIWGNIGWHKEHRPAKSPGGAFRWISTEQPTPVRTLSRKVGSRFSAPTEACPPSFTKGLQVVGCRRSSLQKACCARSSVRRNAGANWSRSRRQRGSGSSIAPCRHAMGRHAKSRNPEACRVAGGLGNGCWWLWPDGRTRPGAPSCRSSGMWSGWMTDFTPAVPWAMLVGRAPRKADIDERCSQRDRR